MSNNETASNPLDNDWEQAILLLTAGGHHHLAGCVQELASWGERLRDELAHRTRQQVIMYSCLENIRDGQNFEGCKRAADIALIAVRQITADMLSVPREIEDGE